MHTCMHTSPGKAIAMHRRVMYVNSMPKQYFVRIHICYIHMHAHLARKGHSNTSTGYVCQIKVKAVFLKAPPVATDHLP